MARSTAASRERQVQAQLQAEGWVVYRSAGSHGCADLVAMKRGYVPMLVQVKMDARRPFDHFPPGERAMLRAQAHQAGCRATLCWWPPRGPIRWIPSDEWPGEMAR